MTLKKCGTDVITVSFAGDDDYEAATATYTLRIGDREGDSGTTFDLSSLLGGSSNKLRTGDVPGAIGDSAKVAITIDADGFATIKFSGDSVLAIANPLGSLLGGSGSSRCSRYGRNSYCRHQGRR